MINIRNGTKTTPQLPATNAAETSIILDASASLFLKQHRTTITRTAETISRIATIVLAVPSYMIETEGRPVPVDDV